MPMAIPIIGAAFVAVGTVATALGVAAVAFTIGSLAVTWAAVAVVAGIALLAVSMLTMKVPKPGSTGQQLDTKLDPKAPVPIAYGRTAAGGTVVYRETSGSKNKFLHMAIMLSMAGPIANIEATYANDIRLNWTGNPVSAPVGCTGTTPSSKKLYRGKNEFFGLGQSKLHMRYLLGATPAPGINASMGSVGSMPGSPGAVSGGAMAVLRAEYDSDAFPQGLPKFKWVLSGVKVYDPRKDSTYPGGVGSHRIDNRATWEFSENPYLCALNWTLGQYINGKKVYGIGAKPAEIDIAAFARGANVADANQWKCGGVVASSDDKFAVLSTILQAGGGLPVATGARISCYVNAPATAIATITADDVVGQIEIQNTSSFRARHNTVVPSYREESQLWNIVQGEPVTAAIYVEEDNDEPKTSEVEFTMVQQAKQAHQLAAYELCNSREFLTFTMACKVRTLGHRVGEAVYIDIPDIAADGIKCTVINREFNPTDSLVTLSLKTESDGKHAFALGQSQVAPPSITLNGYDASDMDAPGSTAWEVTGESITANGNSTPILRIAGENDNPYTASIICEYRPLGSTNWIQAGSYPAATTNIEISTVTAGTQYEVALSYRSVLNAISDQTIYAPVAAGAQIVDWNSVGNAPDFASSIGLTPNSTFDQGIIGWTGDHDGAANDNSQTQLVPVTDYQGAPYALQNTTATAKDARGKLVPYDPARRYRLGASYYTTATAGLEFGIVGFASTTGAVTHEQAVSISSPTVGAWTPVVIDLNHANFMGDTLIAPFAILNTTGTEGVTVSIRALYLEDITESEKAQDSANDAADSAALSDDAKEIALQAAAEAAAAEIAAAQQRQDAELAKHDAQLAAASAATQAAAALVSETNAQAAEALASDAATTATDAASTATAKADISTAQAVIATDASALAVAQATLSSGYADDAAESAGTATAQADISTTQATNATDAAATATEQATLSSEFADDAEAQATIATNQATTATDAAATATAKSDLASGFADVAETSAGIATDQAAISTASAASATASETISATYVAQANLTRAMMLPDRYDVAGGQFFFSGSTGNPTAVTDLPSNATAAAFGPVREFANQTGDSFNDMGTRGVVPAIAGRVYEVSVSVQRISETGSGTASVFSAQVRGLDESYANIGAAPSASVAYDGNVQTATLRVSDVANPANNIVAWASGSVWLRPFVRVQNYNGKTTTVQVRTVSIKDITESIKAGNQAVIATTQAAAATSAASTATSSATLSSSFVSGLATSLSDVFPKTFNPELFSAGASSGTTASNLPITQTHSSWVAADRTYIEVPSGQTQLAFRGVVPVTNGDVFRLTADLEQVISATALTHAIWYVRVLDANYNVITSLTAGGTGTNRATGVRSTQSGTVGYNAPGLCDYNVTTGGAKYFRFTLLVNRIEGGTGTNIGSVSRIYAQYLENARAEANAASSATAANTSETAATAAAATASTDANLAATYKADTIKLNGNFGFDLGKENWFTDFDTGNGAVLYPLSGVSNTSIVTGAAAYFGTDLRVNQSTKIHLFSGTMIPVDTTRKYRFRAQIAAWSSAGTGPTSSMYLGFVGLDANGGYLNHGSFGTYRYCLRQGDAVSHSYQYEPSAVVTGEGNDSWTKFPPGTKNVRLVAILNYLNADIYSYLGGIWCEDVTETEAAASSASVATSQAAIATAGASAASSSAVLAASVAQGLMNPNAGFDDYPNGGAGSLPTGWTNWAGSSGGYRVVDPMGGYAHRMVGAAGQNAGLLLTQATDRTINQNEYYVLEADVILNSGTFQGAALAFHVSGPASGGSTVQQRDMIFTETPDATGVAPGNGVAGRTYKFRKLMQVTTASAYGYRLYAMTHWSSAGSTAAANDITWLRAGIRPATAAEIRDQTILAPMEATVSTVSAAISTLQTRTASYLTKVSAGAGTAELALSATDSGGNAASSITLKADKIKLGTMTTPVLEISGGQATFGTDVYVKGGSSNGRIIIDTGTHMKVQGNGFGNASQFIDWFGPKMAINLCSEANAITYTRKNGDVYTSGSFVSGALSNNGATSSLSPTATTTLGPIGTNGNPIEIAVSWIYRSVINKSYAPTLAGRNSFDADAASHNATSNDGGFTYGGTISASAPAATLELEIRRGTTWSFATQGSTATETSTFSGTRPVIGDVTTNAQFIVYQSISFTYTDTVGGTADRTLLATLSRGNAYGGTVTQRISIVTSEG